MSWGLWNKIKNGIRKVGALLKKPLVRKIMNTIIDKGKPIIKDSMKTLLDEGATYLKNNKTLKKLPLPVDQIIDQSYDFIHPIFK